MLEKLGQSPWYERGDNLFTEQLNKLKEFMHFKCKIIDNVDGNTHTDLDGISSIAPK